MAATKTAGFRKPWTDGAKAYHEADTLDAMWAGIKRMRKPLTVHVSHDALHGVVCAGCGHDVTGPNPDGKIDNGHAYVDADPKTRSALAYHYVCAWGATMNKVYELGRILGY
jgi:hypothetical protein